MALRFRARLPRRLGAHRPRSFVAGMASLLLAAFYPSECVPAQRRAVSWYARAVYRLGAVVTAAILLTGCATHAARQTVRFPNTTPGAPVTIEATLVRPAGPRPVSPRGQVHRLPRI